MTLILLPNLLDDSADWQLYFPKKLSLVLLSLDGLIAESEKNARKYLLRFLKKEQIAKIKIRLLNEHTKVDDIKLLLEEIVNEKWGLISDAGLPCIADPGSLLVKFAKEKNISVQAISGPSCVFLALMLSGFNAQKFAFQGYLPREKDLLIRKIKYLELESSKQKITQIFIETPYRSDKLLYFLLKSLKDSTQLCIATNLTSKSEKVITKSVKEIKKMNLKIGKNPTIFLFEAC